MGLGDFALYKVSLSHGKDVSLEDLLGTHNISSLGKLL